MEPANFKFGGGVTETVLFPQTMILMIIVIGLILFLPRKYVVVPLLLGALLIPMEQVIVVGGIHFFVIRVLVLSGCLRLLWEKFSSRLGPLSGGFNSVDKAFSLWAISYAACFVLLWMEAQALINRLGFLLDVFGMYFLLRFLIRDQQDLRRVFKLLALFSCLMAVCMIGEQLTGRNVFGWLGGPSFPELREGRIRSQGAFRHSILGGTFGATILPLFAGLWRDPRFKVVALLCVIAGTIITFTSASSTPLMAYVAGIVALCLWPLRKHMRVIRWAIVVVLVGLHLVMKAPVWALIARIDIVGGSSGDHRYQLVNACIMHFSDWWLLGAKNYGDWGYWMFDACNQFVAYADSGGLLTLIAFIAIISRSFARIGTARKLLAGDRRQEWFIWSLGACLFAHVVAYWGIGYFDQMQVIWFAFLAITSTVTAHAISTSVAKAELRQHEGSRSPSAVPWVDAPVH